MLLNILLGFLSLYGSKGMFRLIDADCEKSYEGRAIMSSSIGIDAFSMPYSNDTTQWESTKLTCGDVRWYVNYAFGGYMEVFISTVGRGLLLGNISEPYLQRAGIGSVSLGAKGMFFQSDIGYTSLYYNLSLPAGEKEFQNGIQHDILLLATLDLSKELLTLPLRFIVNVGFNSGRFTFKGGALAFSKNFAASFGLDLTDRKVYEVGTTNMEWDLRPFAGMRIHYKDFVSLDVGYELASKIYALDVIPKGFEGKPAAPPYYQIVSTITIRGPVRKERETNPTGNVSGIVVDAASGVPLEGARVKIVEIKETKVTSGRGIFKFLGVPKGAATIICEKEGYRPYAVVADVKADKYTVVNIRMRRPIGSSRTVKYSQWKYELLGEIKFNKGETSVPDSSSLLQKIVEDVKSFPDSKILVRGYAGSGKSASYKDWLSKARAQAVKDWIVSNSDILPEKIEIESYEAYGKQSKTDRVDIFILKPKS